VDGGGRRWTTVTRVFLLVTGEKMVKIAIFYGERSEPKEK